MKAIILAAGMGTRMGKLTSEKPKCMLEFYGETLLKRQIDLFRHVGIKDIIVVVGYKSEKVNYPGCIKVENEKYDRTNMVESLFCTRNHWDDDIIVSYGDILYQRKVLDAIVRARHDINVVVDLNGAKYFRERFGVDFLSKTESLVLSRDGLIVDIGEPNPEISRVEGQYIGLLKFTRVGLEKMKSVYDSDSVEFCGKPWLRSKNFQNGYMTDMVQRLIDKGNHVHYVGIEGGWLEFDSEEDYLTYMSWERESNLRRFFILENYGGKT